MRACEVRPKWRDASESTLDWSQAESASPAAADHSTFNPGAVPPQTLLMTPHLIESPAIPLGSPGVRESVLQTSCIDDHTKQLSRPVTLPTMPSNPTPMSKAGMGHMVHGPVLDSALSYSWQLVPLSHPKVGSQETGDRHGNSVLRQTATVQLRNGEIAFVIA